MCISCAFFAVTVKTRGSRKIANLAKARQGDPRRRMPPTSVNWRTLDHSARVCVPACSQPGDYGRLRTMASVSWTAFAPLAGWVNSTFGIRWGQQTAGQHSSRPRQLRGSPACWCALQARLACREHLASLDAQAAW